MTVADYFLENGPLAVHWHPSRNAPLHPSQVSFGSRKRVWWTCEQGHAWQAAVYAVTGSDSGCPYCTGKLPIPGQTDLATLFPDVAKEWDPERNGALTPASVMPSAHHRVWWRCSLGHRWQAVIFSRTTGRPSGCPYCTGRKVLPGFNDLASLKPKVSAQWHPTLNAPLSPTQVTPGSNQKVWWQCAAGHIWQAAIYSRTRAKGSGCPICAGTVKKSHSPTPL